MRPWVQSERKKKQTIGEKGKREREKNTQKKIPSTYSKC
jgi:hypothetical protein